MALAVNNSEIIKHKKAIKYNDYLIENDIDHTLIEYLKDANDKFYNYDIKFMEEFMELVDRVDFCISHEYLFEYKVATESTTTANVLRLLESRGLKEEKDYMPFLEERHRKNGSKYTKIIYMLTPDAFKKCLIGSAKTDIYSNYFLLLEKIIKYYNQYQLKLNKIERIRLSKKLDNILIDLKESNKINNQLLIENKQQTTKIDQLLIHAEDASIKTEEMAEQLHIISHNQVPELNDQNYTHVYALLRNKEDNKQFHSIRTQKLTFNKRIEKLSKDYTLVLTFKNCPNSIMLNENIKEECGDLVIYKYNDYELLEDVTEQQFIERIKEIYNKRIVNKI